MAFENLVLRDNFTRADEGPPPSANWTNIYQEGQTVGLRVVSNQLKKATSGAFTFGGGYWNALNYGQDVEAAIKFVSDTETGDAFRIGLRLINIGTGTTDGYEVSVDRIAGPSHTWGITRIDNGVRTVLGATFTQTVAANALVGFRAVASSIEAWYQPSGGDWTLLESRSDTTYLTAGKVGICIGDVTDQNVTLDDLYTDTLLPIDLSRELTRTTAPIITQGGGGAWDEGKIGPLSIIKYAAGDYRMTYEGINAGNTLTSIGYATSADGTTWSKDAGNPTFVATETWENSEVSPDTVIYDREAGTFKMWYHGGYNSLPRKIGYATSSDGITWTRGNGSLPVLSPGAAATWDESSVADACVMKYGVGDYRMWYLGKNASNVQAIGYATSTDGISWTKYTGNPIFESGASGEWDDGPVYGLWVMPNLPGAPFQAWYCSDDNVRGSAAATGMGYAYSADGKTWTRGSFNPVLLGTASPEEFLFDPVFAYADGYQLRVIYYYDDVGAAPDERTHGEAVISIPGYAQIAWTKA